MAKKNFRKATEWVALFFALLVAVIFIASGQILGDDINKGFAATLTTLGTLLLSSVSLYMGTRLQEMRAKRKQDEEKKLRELDSYKKYILQISEISTQLSHASHEKNINKKDAIFLVAKDKLSQLIKVPPSTMIISDLDFQKKSKSHLNKIIRHCKKLISKDHPSSVKLEALITIALSDISSYQQEIQS